ncbi:MAG: hypothetical protein HQM14_04150 [SAR324 cluster bacterium]|nr:hypothetical protein [SAR324 cluster bacterium]
MWEINKQGNMRWLKLVLCLLAMTLTFTNCQLGDSKDESITSLEADLNNFRNVGMDVCTNCHYGQSNQWLEGQHGNLNAIDHATHADLDLGLDSDGFPYYGYNGLGTDPDNKCSSCHDPEKDGQHLTPKLTGNTARPVIGCESCHGGGNNHYGVGPIQFAKPDYERCGQCHNSEFDHLAYHPTGDNILEEYVTSPHNKSINEHNYVEEGSTTVRARCSRCHTDEGFKKYNSVPGSTGYTELKEAFEGLPDIKDASVVQCRTCHDPHMANANNLETVSATTGVGGEVTQSSQFNTCTSCHQLNDVNGVAMTDAYHDPAVNQYGALNEVITDTHAMAGDPTRLNTGDSPGKYVFIKPSDSKSCAGCHNPHAADNTVNEQWVQSAHGSTTDDPWIHYDWKAENRQACQRCHTTTGFANYANANAKGEEYVASNNDFSHLTPAATDAEGNTLNFGQNESLYCWGCHTNYKGGIRNPGPIVAPYVDMDGSEIVFPDVAASNVCMGCHTGREGGGSIENSTNDFSNTGFINSHYLTAGANIFTASGYEYSARDYTNVSFYAHDQIGAADADGNEVNPGTGTNGPCVGCHMSATEKHLFEPVTKSDENGEISAISSPACASCHTGQFELTSTVLNEEKAHLAESLEALKVELEKRGYYFAASYPYFFSEADTTDRTKGVRNWLTGSDINSGKLNMGAAYNFNMLEHDPGAFAHNRYYAKRLIYDSIDWLDDNLLNDSVKATLEGSSHQGASYQQDALNYLLNSDGGRP